MPIRTSEHGGTTFTGAGIKLYALIELKHAVAFEGKFPGLQLHRGRSASAIAKEKLGLKRSTKREVILTELEAAIKAYELVVQAENEQGLP